jgi:hypothetical protein
MMCLAPHPEMIEKRDYPAVPDVAIGSHTMLLALEEEVVEQPCDRFARVASTLGRGGEGHADRRQPGIISVHTGSHVADVHAGRCLDDGELEPLPG